MNEDAQELEHHLAVKCWFEQKLAEEEEGREFKCECPLPETMSDKEIKELLEGFKNE